MAYATVADVQAQRPQVLFTATSKPTVAEVQVNVDYMSNFLDAVLGRLGVTVPVDPAVSPKAAQYLKMLVSWACAALAEVQMVAAIAAQGQASEKIRSVFWEMFQAGLKQIQDSPRSLLDAVFEPEVGAAGGMVMTSFFTDNPTDDPELGQAAKMKGTTAAPRFSVRQEF